jgi:hypothetical protein
MPRDYQLADNLGASAWESPGFLLGAASQPRTDENTVTSPRLPVRSREDSDPATIVETDHVTGAKTEIMRPSRDRSGAQMTSTCADDIWSDKYAVQMTSPPKPYKPRFFASPAPFSGCRAKKGPENPISVVDGKPGGARERPMTGPSVSITCCARPGLPVAGRRSAAGAWTTVARTVAVRATVPPSRYSPGGRPSPRALPSWPGGCRPVPAPGSGPGVKPAPAFGDLTGRAEWRVDACGPGRQASASRRPAPGPAATAPGNGEGAHEVTARDRPAPAPAGLPLRQGRVRPAPLRRAARWRGLSSLSRSPGRPPRTAAERPPGGGRT